MHSKRRGFKELEEEKKAFIKTRNMLLHGWHGLNAIRIGQCRTGKALDEAMRALSSEVKDSGLNMSLEGLVSR